MMRIKQFLAFFVGLAVISASVASIWDLFNYIFNWLRLVDYLWNALFGVLMVLWQLRWIQWLTKNFGFMTNWFGRGAFYLYVGSEVFDNDVDTWWVGAWSILVSCAAVFVGVMELTMGFQCSKYDDEDTERQMGEQMGEQMLPQEEAPPPPAKPGAPRSGRTKETKFVSKERPQDAKPTGAADPKPKVWPPPRPDASYSVGVGP